MISNLRRRLMAAGVVVAVAAGVNVATAAPAAAYSTWSCSGLGIGFGHDGSFSGDITISGVKYGEFRWGVTADAWSFSSTVAVLDTRADGKAPYVYNTAIEGGATITYSRLQNNNGAGGGWQCFQLRGSNPSFLNPYTEVALWGSNANSPSVPNLRFRRYYVPS